MTWTWWGSVAIYTPSGAVSSKGLGNARNLLKFYHSKPTCIKFVVQVIGQNITQTLSKNFPKTFQKVAYNSVFRRLMNACRVHVTRFQKGVTVLVIRLLVIVRIHYRSIYDCIYIVLWQGWVHLGTKLFKMLCYWTSVSESISFWSIGKNFVTRCCYFAMCDAIVGRIRQKT